MNKNLLNDLKENDIIYRAFNLKFFLNDLDSGTLTMIKPELWEDVNENYILKSLLDKEKSNQVKNNIRIFINSLYGQCWTTNGNFNELIEYFGKNNKLIIAKTTVGNLLETLQLSMYSLKNISCHIGKVKYDNYASIKSPYNFPPSDHDRLKNTIETFLFKNREFIAEQEVRLIFYDIIGNKGKSTTPIKINDFYLFESIYIDDRIADEERLKFAEVITERIGDDVIFW